MLSGEASGAVPHLATGGGVKAEPWDVHKVIKCFNICLLQIPCFLIKITSQTRRVFHQIVDSKTHMAPTSEYNRRQHEHLFILTMPILGMFCLKEPISRQCKVALHLYFLKKETRNTDKPEIRHRHPVFPCSIRCCRAKSVSGILGTW